eukprot:10925236-Alexandrium_andersonii.AAC.1
MPRRYRPPRRRAGAPCGRQSEGPCGPRGGARAHRPADGWQGRRAAISRLQGVEWPRTRSRP